MTIYVRPLKELVPPELIEVLGEKGVLKSMVGSLAVAARDHWIRLAAETFHTTRRDYVNAIQPVRFIGDTTAVVALVGRWPDALENGMSAYDQRTTLLGPNVPVVPPGERGKHAIWKKMGKGAGRSMVAVGYYRHIPFRHLPPSSKSMLGVRMGSALEDIVPERARALGKRVYEMAKQLQPYQTVYGGAPAPAAPTAEGGYHGVGQPPRKPGEEPPPKRLRFTVEDFGEDAEILNRLYGGMVRQEKTYQRATQSTFFTFRTISTRGPAWKHPGLPGAQLAKKVSEHVARIAEQSFSAFAKGSQG